MTRRSVLSGALLTSLALGLSSQALASIVIFPAYSSWKGPFTSTVGQGTGTAKLTMSQSTTQGTLTLGGVSISVTISGTTSNTLIVGTGIRVQGKRVTLGNNNLSFYGIYQKFNGRGVVIDQGRISILQVQLLGVIDDTIDGNQTSTEIFPPDFLGQFLSSSGPTGQLSFHHDIVSGVRGGTPYSETTGRVSFNTLSFSFVMTFLPQRNADGSFSFDLIGDTGVANSAVPQVVMSGAYFPSTGQVVVGSLRGGYGMLDTRGFSAGMGSFSMLQVP